MSATSWKDRAKVSASKSPSQPSRSSSKAARASADETPMNKPKPIPPKPGIVPAYYDTMTSSMFMLNHEQEYQRFADKPFSYELRQRGYFRDVYHDNGLSYLEQEYLRIVKEQSVHFAGQVGGFDAGVYEMMGSRVLVTRGPKWIQPKDGTWALLRDFFLQLLGEQCKYAFAWIKWALDSIRRGLPWSPGQMLAVAGPPNSGKSLFQSLLTPILGGRASSPYDYMTEKTRFNCDVFGAEHALIGDQNHAVDMRARRNFGSAIKTLCVNKEQRVEGKNKTAATLLPFLRVSITLNDNPEALLVLPPLDSDVKDKIILLHASRVKFPWPSKEFPDSQTYFTRLCQELPAFLFHLRKWRIPQAVADTRYGVTSWLNPQLVEKVEDLSPESKLWEAIQSYLFDEYRTEFWQGTSGQLERELEAKMKGGAAQRLFPYSTACGVFLAKLEKKLPELVTSDEARARKRVFTIRREVG